MKGHTSPVRLACILLATQLLPNAAPAQTPRRAELVVQTGHTGEVMSVRFAPDGRTLASEGDGTLKLWDARSGQELRTIATGGNSAGQSLLVFGPDGKTLTNVTGSKTVVVWDIERGEKLRTVAMSYGFGFPVTFSADGKTVASGDVNINLAAKKTERTIKLGDAESGRELRTLTGLGDSLLVSLAFSPDGKILAGASPRTVRLWDTESGQELRSLALEQPPFGTSLVFSPDGKLLAGLDGLDKTVRLWDVQTGQLLHTLAGHAYGNNSLAFSPDGQVLACAGVGKGVDRSAGSIKLWEVRSGRELRTLTGRTNNVRSVAFSPDGKTLAGGASKTVILWDAEIGRELHTIEGPANETAWLAVSDDGKVLAKGDRRSVRLWSLPNGQELPAITKLRDYVSPRALSPDGRILASEDSDGGTLLWDTQRGEVAGTLEGHINWRFAIFSPDGKIIASGSDDQTIRLWDAQSGRELHTLKGHTDKVWALAFTRDGKTLASGGNDETIKLWDVQSGRELRTLADVHDVSRLTVSPDGQTVAAGNDPVTLWDVKTGQKSHTLYLSSGARAFSPDGKLLATGGGFRDSVIMIWDTASGEKLRNFSTADPQTKAAVTTLVPDFHRRNNFLVTADGKWGFSSGENGRIDLYEFETGKPRASLFTMGTQDWLAVTPDGLFDGTPAAWKSVIWRLDGNTFRYAPVEAFFSDYFRPGLLEDLFRGESLTADVDISRKDIRQPVVTVSLAGQQPKAGGLASREVTVKVNVVEAPPDERRPEAASGARDVRLFRNGSLVKVWRGDVLKGKGHVTLAARVPVVAGENRFTAYAFNRDNVKSPDATLTVSGADSLRRAGTLHVLAVGVNEYANPQYDLKFAVADAREFGAEVKRQQERLGQYARVEVTPLYDREATKANVMRALAGLAGRVQPEDGLIVYFAGHGVAHENRFYLIPHDLGYAGPRDEINDAVLLAIREHSISDRELEAAFEGVDAGQILFVVDACNSGQALEAEEKRRGPMNSKGLAQLAYEKGMYVLTASQSLQVANEEPVLGHGYLTYVLVNEGLQGLAADREPADGSVLIREWFDYAEGRVPRLHEEQMRKKSAEQLAAMKSRKVRELGLAYVVDVQRPRVFYRREPEARPLVVARPGAAPARQ